MMKRIIDSINMKLEKNIGNIVVFFLFMQPFLDIISGVSTTYLDIDISLNVIARGLFLGLSLYYLITRFDKKTNQYLYILGIYIILFLTASYHFKGYGYFLFDLRNTINTFYFPIVFIAIYKIFESKKINFKIAYLVYLFYIYIYLIFLPNLLNTGFLSYAYSKVGTTGFFISANAVGSIIAILMPIVINYYLSKKMNFLIVINALITLYVLFSMGTKTPIIALILIIFVNIIALFKYLFTKKHYVYIYALILILFGIGTLSINLLPKTSFYKNLVIHIEFLEIKNPIEVVTNYKIVDHFIFSERLTFLSNTHTNYMESNSTLKVVGIGYTENYLITPTTKIIEMDYFDVLYRHGLFGFIIYFLPLIYYFKKHIKDLLESSYNYFTTICLILVLAMFVGHLFVTPAVSIYVAILLSLVHLKKV